MPTFQYRAYGSLGNLEEGQIAAQSTEAAEAALVDRGLVPFQLKESANADERVPWWRRDIFSTGPSSRAVLGQFTRELAELCSSDIPIDACLDILSAQSASPVMRPVAAKLLSAVRDGTSLADAMRKQAGRFPEDYQNVVRAGEASGTLASALDELAELLAQRAAVEAKVWSALTYPAILFGLAAISVVVIVSVLVPSIVPIFEQSGKRPPELLRIVIWVRDNGAWLGLAGAGAVGLAGATFAWIRRDPRRLYTWDAYMLKVPVIGPLVLERETARFARTLGTLLKAGVPLLQGAVAATSVVASRVIAAKLDRAIGMIREGRSLANALSTEQVFPDVALRMIAVGEETARLDRMLLRTAGLFEQRIERGIDRLMTLLTPALTVAVAFIVGGLIMVVMNAILSVNDLAAG
ncbi:type II secretion system F family protein [Bradyrhizobium sp. WD16]|uniref:type II secretion system F family protein n=1 Tax=Bradyrhizobium sp. WD16 TaxID=1521768 RepID=UPI0020A29192|nr:type II secretion system F family protein [Bradyrhizobium sp. WD16]